MALYVSLPCVSFHAARAAFIPARPFRRLTRLFPALRAPQQVHRTFRGPTDNLAAALVNLAPAGFIFMSYRIGVPEISSCVRRLTSFPSNCYKSYGAIGHCNDLAFAPSGANKIIARLEFLPLLSSDSSTFAAMRTKSAGHIFLSLSG